MIVTRDSRAPEVIRRQRDAVARYDARQRRARIRRGLESLAASALVLAAATFIAYSIGLIP